jgi:xanthine dehydrogenase YagR molybdenum-binding subunit
LVGGGRKPGQSASRRGPVKLSLTRPEMFTGTGRRPSTMHHLKIAATPDGKLVAIHHEATSTPRCIAIRRTRSPLTLRESGISDIGEQQTSLELNQTLPTVQGHH